MTLKARQCDECAFFCAEREALWVEAFIVGWGDGNDYAFPADDAVAADETVEEKARRRWAERGQS